jgi:hypothetical protein
MRDRSPVALQDRLFADPPDHDAMPRFADIPTFMRLPYVAGGARTEARR